MEVVGEQTGERTYWTDVEGQEELIACGEVGRNRQVSGNGGMGRSGGTALDVLRDESPKKGETPSKRRS